MFFMENSRWNSTGIPGIPGIPGITGTPQWCSMLTNDLILSTVCILVFFKFEKL
jgi:hypothetical protein